jgi:F-type H+-transporting ATPase subunit a
MLYEAMLGFVEQIVGSKEAARSIFPLVATLFIYIGASNLIGLIPGVTNFTYNETPIFRTPTADFNTTFGLAFAMVTLIQYIDIKRSGMFAYLGKYFQFKQVWDGFKEGLGAGFVAIIHFCIGLLDIISEFAKIASLALRLFGNMYAGEVLAVILLGAIAYIVPSVWLAMNLLTGVVQAMVFGALIAAYYSLVARSEEGK